MNRGLLVLLLVVALGLGAALCARHFLQGPPSAWLSRKYALSPQQAERMQVLEKEYGSRCGPFCTAMCEANSHLETLTLGSGSVTPEIRTAVAETDRIRTETRLAMLEHFYAVAAELPPERRREYLLKVLPLVIESCGSESRNGR
jgi:hypothetical protein